MCTFRSPAGFLLVLLAQGATAQCVTAYPALEDFETAPVWSVNGVSPDWAWGTPAHPLINAAGGGTQCWCVGGLSGSFYNLGQQSWIESGCYDLSLIYHPWVSFKIFWETERQYDGANLQYSLNGGATWTNVGAYGDPVDCLNDNWYNYDNVLNLSAAFPRHGWSGRVGATSGSCVGGFGSGAWLEAKHCLPVDCALQPDVRFRFLFGAGTTCNNYDGVAIDDFLVSEAPIDASIGSLPCTGSTMDFFVTITGCGTLVDWDFGDPASGVNNTSTLATPNHVFSGPGSYTVTAHVTGPCGVDTYPTMFIAIQDVQVTVTDPLCADSTGSATVVITGPITSPSILWTPGGATTATVTGLAPGAYTVEVQDIGTCVNTVPFNVVMPPALSLTTMNDTTLCDGADLNMEAYGIGGTGVLGYTWSPAGPLLVPAAPGTYTVFATDANGCISNTDSVVVGVAPPVEAAFSLDPAAGCAPLCVTFTDESAGTASNDWTFGDGTTLGSDPSPEHCYTTSGTYSVSLTVTDAFGCTGTLTLPDTVEVFAAPVAGFLATPTITTINDPLIHFSDASTGASQWTWTFDDPAGSMDTASSVSFTFPDVGCYTVEQIVTNTEGCADSTSVLVCVEDEFALYVPNAFTPNGDGINDAFLPITTVFFPKEYVLDIFDRWGQPLFSTADMHEAWKGENVPLGVYIWKLRLRGSDGGVHEAVGHVALVR